MSNKAIFFHWGPGANASVERLWFEDKLSIHWWDQPKVFSRPESALRETTDAALAEVESLTPGAEAVHLIAHSFGGVIAREILRLRPEKVKSATFLGCSIDPVMAFVNLGRSLAAGIKAKGDIGLSTELSELATRAENHRGADTLWPLIGKIATIPDFLAAYWHNAQARERYFGLLPRAMPMDMAAFAAVMNSYLALNGADGDLMRKIENPIPTRCIFGEFDPLLNLGQEIQAWKRMMPGAEICILPVGHFVHFEAGISDWAPELVEN